MAADPRGPGVLSFWWWVSLKFGWVDAAEGAVIVPVMTYTVRIIAFAPDEEGNLPNWLLGDPPRSFAFAELANDAGMAEVSRLASEGTQVTFVILDDEGHSVSHRGRRGPA